MVTKSLIEIQTKQHSGHLEGDRNFRKLAFTVSEATEILSISKTTLYAKLGSGELQARKCGKKTLILAEDLRQFLSGLETIQASSSFAKE